MSLELTHQQIQELLGAFALDAVEGDEAEAIELHLRECPQCRAEVTEQREVAALLAHSGSPAPEGVWGRILQELEPAPPALRMPPQSAPSPSDDVDEQVVEASETNQDPSDSTVVELSSRRSTVRMRTLIAVVTAAAVIVAALGIVALNQSHRLDRLETSLRDVSVDRIAAQAMSDPQATNSRLTSSDGRINAAVVVDAKGMGYLLAARLPKLPRHKTYQLWGQVGRSVLSLGVFDGATDVVQFQVGNGQRHDLSGLLVTEEDAPGVTVTKQRPLLTGAV